MARRKRKFNFCPKNRFRFLTPSLCSVCDSLQSCDSFYEYYQKNKRKYNNFVYETIEKFPEKYQLEVIFMAAKQVFVQIVDKKSGQIEEVIDMKTLEALNIDKKVALTKGKELYIVTHRIEPVIKIEMKQVKISDPISYIEHEENLTLVIDEEEQATPEEIVEELPAKTVKKAPKKTEKKPVVVEDVKVEAVEKAKVAEEVVEKKKTPRKKKTE